MCGIGGMISAHPLSDAAISAARAGVQHLYHRGPDGFGEVTECGLTGTDTTRLYLGMRRLSIIDLNGGWQPLYNEDRSVALVCNGEIYNYRELRAELETRGHVFRTGSDCEVIVHLYEWLGLDFLTPLRGMFALALWDAKARRLILARDRLGEKPLYLYERPGSLLFSSEAKGLLATGQVPFELDPVGVDLFMHYHWVPEPRTAIRGVRKLPAGCLLEIQPDTWTLTERRYWRIEDAPALTTDPEETIAAEMDQACELIVRSDVPVGVALSAGFDSSAIAALVADKYPGTLQTFTVGYEGQHVQDERTPAVAFAKQLGLPSHEIEIGLADVVRDFRALNLCRDDPISDIAGYGYYSIAQAARAAGCPVLLQGQGADELAWGYPWARQSVAWLRRPAPGRGGLWDELAQLGPLHTDIKAYAQAVGSHVYGWGRADCRGGALRQPYQFTRSFRMAEYLKPRMFAAGYFADGAASSPAHAFAAPGDGIGTDIMVTQYLLEGYLRENGLAQGDRLSSAHGVELRLPFCDYRLAETVVGLRKHRADDGLGSKAWLKGALGRLLPEWVLQRPKTGFSPPVLAWFDALGKTYGAHVADGYLVRQDIITPLAARRFLSSRSRLSAWFQLCFSVLVLEIWAEEMDALARYSRDSQRDPVTSIHTGGAEL
ncbi:asparagine synthase (glutamine-hydrolyzing) [Methylomagnum sp.]